MEMMKSFFCLLFLSSSLLAAGNLPWIGVTLNCPKGEDSLSAGLPEGVGLKVRHVTNNGPLEKSGGLRGDMWWKFDGQILVSRGQLLVLLREKKPGDRVEVEYYRNKKAGKLSLELAKKPGSEVLLISTKESPTPPGQGLRRLASSVETAELTVNGESLSLEKISQGWKLTVTKDDKVLFDKELTVSGLSASLEPRWMEPFMVLQMTLAQKSQSDPGQKKSRIRYISRDPKSEETN